MLVMILSRSFAVCGFLSELLTDEGYEVDALRNPSEALAELGSRRHGLVIIDEALQHEVPLASLGEHAPILLLASGRRRPSSTLAHGVLTRPIDAGAVRRSVRSILGWPPVARATKLAS